MNFSVNLNSDVQRVATVAVNMAQDFLDGERVLAFDLETTGVNTSSDRIIEICMIKTDAEGNEIGVYLFVEPLHTLSPSKASERKYFPRHKQKDYLTLSYKILSYD